MKKVIAKHAAIPVVVGLITIGVVIYAEHHLPYPLPKSTLYAVLPYSIKFLDHLAVAFLSIGAIGIILEIPHLHDYFYGLFVDALTDPKYIQDRKKDDGWLKSQQMKLMAGLFGKNEEIAKLFLADMEKPGSFFHYYYDQLQSFIGAPYRADYVGITTITPGANSFDVEEELSYQCCKLGKDIQKEAGWTAYPDELIDMLSLKIEITLPNATQPDEVVEPDPATLKPNPHWGYMASLDKYKGIDGLRIKIRLHYTVAPDRAFATDMHSISRNLNWTINYPPNMKIHLDRFVFDRSIEAERPTPGQCTFNYPQWVLPGHGFAFHLRKDGRR